MAIEVTSIDELDPDEIENSEQRLSTFISEQQPQLDLSKGTVLQQTIIQTNAVIDVVHREETDKLRRSNSLLAISEDPTLADDDTVDRVLSNYLISRDEATTASGTAFIVVTTEVPVTIPDTAVFTSGERTFAPTQTFSALLLKV